MTKQRVAIVTVEVLLEPGGPALQLIEAIEHVGDALSAYDKTGTGQAPMRYADFNVIDARLVREK